MFPPIFVADTKIIYGYNFVAPSRALKSSFNFSMHHSSKNVSIRSVVILKSLNVSLISFFVADIPFDTESKGFSLKESLKVNSHEIFSRFLLILDFCRSV